MKTSLISSSAAEGTKVCGKYCDFFAYSGVISNVRFAPRGSYYYTVKLDSPIEVFGDVRTEIGFYSGDDDAKNCEVISPSVLLIGNDEPVMGFTCKPLIQSA